MIVVKPKKSWGEKCHFQGAVWDFSTLVSVTFFWYCLVEIQLLNLKGLEKLDFIKWPKIFDKTNQSRDISTDPNKRFWLYYNKQVSCISFGEKKRTSSKADVAHCKQSHISTTVLGEAFPWKKRSKDLCTLLYTITLLYRTVCNN